MAGKVCRDHPGTAIIVASANDVGDRLPEDISFLRKPYNVHELIELVKALAHGAHQIGTPI